jgi:hypothetical protein
MHNQRAGPMKVIEINTSLAEMEPLMYDVKLITQGYLTEAASFVCKAFEKFATLQSQEKVVFYANEKDQVFSIHFAHTLDLQNTICAIDYFPDHSKDEVVQIANLLLEAMKKYWQDGKVSIR